MVISLHSFKKIWDHNCFRKRNVLVPRLQQAPMKGKDQAKSKATSHGVAIPGRKYVCGYLKNSAEKILTGK